MSWSPSFREQIYELLEQSKVVHQVKDKEKRKTLTMTKDLEQLLKNNEKRVKEDKWDNDAKELRDLISKQQKRLKREKELGELTIFVSVLVVAFLFLFHIICIVIELVKSHFTI